jgi:hypothetical protein
VLGLILLAGLTIAATAAPHSFLAGSGNGTPTSSRGTSGRCSCCTLGYFSYKRWISGIVLTLIALVTSIAWFPRPDRVQPRVEEFLAFEHAWLTSGGLPGRC